MERKPSEAEIEEQRRQETLKAHQEHYRQWESGAGKLPDPKVVNGKPRL